MGTKLNPGPYDCYARAEPDEPMFVLLARDRWAPFMVSLWATIRFADGEDEAVTDEAAACAVGMMQWAQAHGRMPMCGTMKQWAAFLRMIAAQLDTQEDLN